MAARQDETKETAEEKKTEPGMAGMMDRCKCMTEADMAECCGPRMRQMMSVCCATPSDETPAPPKAEA